MKTYFSRKSLLYPLAFLLALLPFSSVFAGTSGVLVYAPVASNIPTLSGTMLIILSLLLVAVSFRIAKQKDSGAKHFVITILGVGALISASGSVKLFSDAYAAMSYEMKAAGGQLPVAPLDLNIYNNNSNVAQKISKITLPTDTSSTASAVVIVTPSLCPDNPPQAPAIRCKEGMTVQHGENCVIDCTYSPDEN